VALTPYDGEEVDAPKLTPYEGPEVGPAAPPSRLRRFVADPLISATKGAIGLPEAVVGVADIATGGLAGKAAEAVGFRPKEAKATLDTLYSLEQQAANAEVSQADGFVPRLKASFRNPSTIAHTVIESAPSMLGGAGVARGLMKAGVPVVAAAAAGEGVMSAGSTAEQIRQESPTGLITGKQAAIAAGSGAATGALGVAGGRLARRFGIADVDTALAGGAQAAKTGTVKALAGGVASEGLLEEMPQSAQEQAAQNLATGKPLTQGVGAAAASGALAGGVMGGGTSAAFNLAAKAAGVGGEATKIKEELDELQDLFPEEQKPAVEALAARLNPEDSVAFQAEALDRLDAGDHPLDAETQKVVEELAGEAKPEETRAALLEAVAESLSVEENPLEILQAKEEAKVVEALKPVQQDLFTPEEPVVVQEGSTKGRAIPAEPVADPSLLRAQTWAKAGRTVLKEGLLPDAEVAAHLDDLGFTLVKGERLDRTAGGSAKRREWRIEKKAEAAVEQAAALAPQEPKTLLSGQQMELSPTETLMRKDDKVILVMTDPRGKRAKVAQAEKNAKGEFEVDAGTAESPEAAQRMVGALRQAGLLSPEGARFARVASFADAGIPKSVVGSIRSLIAQGVQSKLKMSESITDAELSKVSHAAWESIGVQESLDKETTRLREHTWKNNPAWVNRSEDAKQSQLEKHLNAIRRNALAFYISEKLKQDATAFSRTPSKADIQEAKQETVRRLADAKGIAAAASQQGITADDLTSRLEVQLDQYNQILAGRATYADLQAPVEAEALRAHLAPIVAKLKIPVKVVATGSEIPGLRPDAPAFNGVFHNGTIYLNAEHITSLKEAEDVLLRHELQHAGLRSLLGRDGLEKLLAKAWGDLGSGVREFAKSKGIDTKDKEGKLEATEEYIVELAKTDAKHPLWDRFVEIFKAALRKLGFDLKYTDTELRSLVARAGEVMQRKGEENAPGTSVTEDDGGAGGELERVRAAVAEALGKPVIPGGVRISRETEVGRHLSGIGAAFRKKVVVFESLNGLEVPDGFIRNTDPSTIYINANASEPHLAVFGHELLHTIELSAPELYAPFEAFVRSQITAEGAKKYLKAFPKPRAGKEVVADTVGALLAEKDFWVEMSKENPTLFQKVLAYVSDLISRVFEKNGGRFPAQATAVIYKDFNKIRTVTAKLISDYEKANPETRFARTLSDPKALTAFTKKLDGQVAKRVLSDLSGNIWRAVMPVDRTIRMAQSMPLYAPIKAHLETYLRQKRAKAAAGDEPPTRAQTIRLEFEKAFKTDAEHKAFDDLTLKATLYEQHADGRNAGWTEASWKESGKLEQTGKTLGEARAEIAALWKKLNPEQRRVQQKIIDHMKVLSEQFRAAQLEPLRASFGDEAFDLAEQLSEQLWKLDADGIGKMYEKHGADAMSLAEQIAMINSDRGQLKGDYAPLMRFGDHVVRTLEADSEKRVKTEFFETKQQAMDAVARIRGEAGVFPVYDLQTEGDRNVTNIPLAFLEKMKMAAEARGLSGEALDALMDDFKAARLQTMPRYSVAGHSLKREGVEGYSTDALRSYATYVAKSARAIANLKYGTAIDQSFRDMNNSIKAYQDPSADWSPHAVERMSSLKDNLYRLEMQHNAEKVNEFTKAVGKATFLWYLSSPSVWAVQWSQPFMTTIPKMAARYGVTKAFGAYVKEAKRYLAGEFSDEKIEAFNVAHENAGERLYDLIQQERKALPAEKAGLRKAMQALYNGFDDKGKRLLILKTLGLQGMLDLSSSHALQDLITGASDGQKMLDDVVNKGAFFMQKSETGSRRAAAVSSFQLALSHGKDFMEANDYASNIIDDTLADFSSQNRPGLLRGNTGRILGQFQFFRLHMLGKMVQLAKDAYGEKGWGEARKELAYMTGMSMGLAGAAGTPVALLASNTVTSAIWAGLAAAFGDPDDPWEPKREFENMVREAVGDTAGNAFLKGLPAMLGADISKRVGLGGMANVISGEPPPGLSGTQKAQWYAGRVLGPAFGIASDSMRAIDALSDGDLGLAVTASSPKVVKDFAKAYNLTERGAVGAGGNTLIQPEDVSPVSIALQLLGINPTEVSLAQDERRAMSGLTVELRQRRSLLVRRMTEATMEGDFEAREEALEAINAWGEKQPEMKIAQSELLEAVKRGIRARSGILTEREKLIQEKVRGE